MFGRQKKPSKNIEKFAEQLYQFEKEHPDELCPMETDPQLVVNCLSDVFLGVDWYTPMPVNMKQVNTIILDKILRDWSEEFRILVNKKKKQWKEERDDRI